MERMKKQKVLHDCILSRFRVRCLKNVAVSDSFVFHERRRLCLTPDRRDSAASIATGRT